MLHGSTGRIFFHPSLLRRPSLTKVLCLHLIWHNYSICTESQNHWSLQVFCSCLIQPLLQSRTNQSRCSRAWSTWTLSILKDGDGNPSTSLCLCSATQDGKVLPRMKWEFPQVQLCPPAPILLPGTKSSSVCSVPTPWAAAGSNGVSSSPPPSVLHLLNLPSSELPPGHPPAPRSARAAPLQPCLSWTGALKWASCSRCSPKATKYRLQGTSHYF